MDRKEMLLQAMNLSNELFQKAVADLKGKNIDEQAEAYVCQKVFEMLSSMFLRAALVAVEGKDAGKEHKEHETMQVIQCVLRNGTSGLDNIEVGSSISEEKAH